MKHEPRIYETVFIVNANLEDTQIEAIIEKTKDVILKYGGEIHSIEKWGRRRLAYAIKKKNNGFYTLIEFKAPGEAIARLNRFFQLEEEVIRHLVLALDKKALKAKEVALKAAADAAAQESAAATTVSE
ncbi:MAG: 30S ribosomal protein S6 [Acidobacteriota bacterium]